MIQQIKDFEASRVALEKVLNSSNVQLSKKALQLSKKKAKHSNAAKLARTKKVALIADIAKKSSPAKTKRLKKINETIHVSSAEAKTLNVELQTVRAELKEVKAALVRYKGGFKVFDKAVNSHDKAIARKATKTVQRRVKRKVAPKK